MLFSINSSYVLNFIFSLLDPKEKLKIIKYNKSIQKKLEITLDILKKISGRYLIKEENNFSKEFTLTENILVYAGGYKNGKRNGYGIEYTDSGVIKFKGEYLNGKRNGEGKVYERFELNGIDYLIFSGNYKNGKKNGLGRKYDDNKIKFEGEYLNDIKEGFGKQFFSNGKIKFEGVYKGGKKWTGKGYDPDGKVVYELIEGKGYFKKYKYNFNTLEFLFEGEFINGQRNGKGKEYQYNKIIFEGEYLNNKRHGQGIKYYDDKTKMFIGEYKEGKQWNGKGYDPDLKEIYEIKNGQGFVKFYTFNRKRSYCYFEGEIKDGIKNGKGIEYWQGKCTPRYKQFEGIYKNDEKFEGKLYETNQLIYEGNFMNGERWTGINKIVEKFGPPGEQEFEGEYLNGKKWKGIEKNFRGYNILIEYNNGKIWNVKCYSENKKNKNLLYEIKEGNGLMKYFEKGENNEEYVSFEVELKNGEIKGKAKEYNSNGKIEFEGEYYNNYRNGKAKEYNSNGKIEYEGEYYNNYRNGQGKEYYSNGNIKFEGEYLHSKKINGYFYTPNGQRESELKNGQGKIKEYDDINGKIIFEGDYKYGEKWNGNTKEYNEDNKVSFDGVYKNGKKEGKHISYHNNGNIKIMIEEPGFNVKTFYEDGKLKSHMCGDNVVEYYQNGKINFDGEYFFGQRKKGKEFDDKGNFIFEGKYQNGKKWEGIFKEYDDSDKVINEGNYLKGEKIYD